MSLFAYLNGSDVGNKVRLGAAGLETHADGTPGFGNIVFDDEAASLTVRGWMSVKVVETACTSAPVLFYGYIGPRTYSRTSGNVTYKVGASRFIDTTLVDLYARLSHRLITGSDGKRPAEDHNERIDWLLDSAYLTGLIEDFGLVDRSHPRPFEESDYRGQKPDDVLTDLAGPIFKSFFAYWDQTEDAAGLFFDEATTATNTSTLTISNVLSDITITGGVITGTCYPPSVDAALTRDPSEVYSRGRETYKGGTVIESDTTTLATFFDDNDLGHRGIQVNNDRVGVESTARIQLDGILDRASEEHDTIQVTIQLPPAQVGLVDAGMRIGVRFSHCPGYETQQFMRVTTRHVTQTEGSTSLYDVTLVLDNQGFSSAGHGNPGGFPLPPPVAPSIVQQVSGAGNIHMPADITAGNTLIYAGVIRSSSMIVTWDYTTQGYVTAPDGETTDPSATNAAVVVYRVAGSGESRYLDGSAVGVPPGGTALGTWYELEGTWTPDTNAERAAASTTVSTPSITVAANSITVGVAGQGAGGAYDGVINTLSFTSIAGWTEDLNSHASSGHPTMWNGHVISTAGGSLAMGLVNSGNGGLSGTDYDYIAQIVSFTNADLATDNPPMPGQQVPWEVITMTGAEGTATHPYATGSLKLRLNGMPVAQSSFTETDPACGDFTLAWVPFSDDVITASYDGI